MFNAINKIEFKKLKFKPKKILFCPYNSKAKI